MVEQILDVEDVSTLEIPYYLVQIPVANALVTPLVITVLASFPYESKKIIPWNYGSTVYLYGQKQEKSLLKVKSLLLTSLEPVG